MGSFYCLPGSQLNWGPFYFLMSKRFFIFVSNNFRYEDNKFKTDS